MTRNKGALTGFEGLCVLFVIVGLGLLLLTPFAGDSKQAARRTAGLSNARQLSMALTMYCDNDNGIYPYVLHSKSLVSVLGKYLRPQSSFGTLGSQWDTLNADQKGTFEYNLSLGGVERGRLLLPERTPTIFDPYLRRGSRGGWQRLVAFADGFTRYISISDWPEYRGNLLQTLPPHGNPID